MAGKMRVAQNVTCSCCGRRFGRVGKDGVAPQCKRIRAEAERLRAIAESDPTWGRAGTDRIDWR